MIRILIAFSLMFLIIPFTHANALPRESELILENIQIEPNVPQKGNSIVITGDVYNSGIADTNSLASIITIAYFIDGNLVYVDTLDNVKPGITNKIKISSKPVWNAESGDHIIRVVVDYHNTLNDQYDSPDNNVAENFFSITSLKPAKISINASPDYLIQKTNTLLTVVTTLTDSSSLPISNKRINLVVDGKDSSATTDNDGKAYFSEAINAIYPVALESQFAGDDTYSFASSSFTLYPIPQEIESAIIVKIIDSKKQYTFEKYNFEFLLFQDSYDNLFKKITPGDTLLDSKTFWISLPPNHKYFMEVYVNGRFLSITNLQQLEKNHVVLEEVKIPESAQIRFRVTNESGEPQDNVTVDNWVYSAVTGKDGFTDWVDVLPTITENDPYVAEVLIANQKVKSDPFFVFSDEKKTISIIYETNVKPIPDWIRNNAKWWAERQIDDSSFVNGMQFLINEEILNLPPTVQSGSAYDIPDWIRNNAKWWAERQIDDSSFVNGMQFLINEGILKIQ